MHTDNETVIHKVEYKDLDAAFQLSPGRNRAPSKRFPLCSPILPCHRL